MMRSIATPLLAMATLALHAQSGYDPNATARIAAREAGPVIVGQDRSGAPPTRGYDLKYMRCAWEVDPSVHYISGSVTSWFEATSALEQVVFDLSDDLDVASVTMHGEPLTFTHGQQNNKLAITLPQALAPGTLDSVTVSYSGVPSNTGFGSFVTSTHAGIPILWTLSEPYGAQDWWPTKEDLNDKVDSIDCLVTTPLGYRAAGNGMLVGADTVAAQVTWHWKHRYPIAHYLIAMAVTDYAVNELYVQLGEDSLLMLTYAYPEQYEAAVDAATDVLPVIVLFDSLFGPYPYPGEKYGHADFNWGGGMEHQTMSFLGTYQKDVVCHELAHQWFGNKVTHHSWAEIWLTEGFATYLSGLYYEFLNDYYWAGWKRSKINGVVSEPGGSVFCTDTTTVGRLFDARLTYNKAAMVLHMLRWVCGDEAFFQGARNYLADPQLAYKTATTADLQAHLEATSGLDLTEFLEDWYVGEGFPSYNANWSQQPDGDVSVLLSQITSHPSVSFFKLPVPLRFYGAGQDSTVVLDHTINEQQFLFHLPFDVDSVVVDPDDWLIRGESLVTNVSAPTDTAQLMHVYPNPAHTFIAWQQSGQTLFHWASVVDATGSRLFWEPANQGRLDISNLPAGMYVLELVASDQVRRVRFIKR